MVTMIPVSFKLPLSTDQIPAAIVAADNPTTLNFPDAIVIPQSGVQRF